ncbi:heme-binding protein [Pseudothauera nasutitermitis]|uniref:Heme-binding protein n=1 Tax=Pseudothauera nasutitermitis TaxID=2565930 RepID=A0A4S4ARQ3_9RHOO|nr:heme-binding protein [Pseudothauera nasutitermitis]THF61854.1 heme-binding protein [Pseudothauera nasutitermitis]
MNIAVPQATISWEAAHAAVKAAVGHARSLGVRINVAVADCAGNLVAFLRMPGAFPQSVRIAIDKAHTAGGFGFPTAQWMDVCAGDEGMRLGFSAQPGLIVFGGGLPIRAQGQLIGGIGVSGASAQQDEACARAGLLEIGADAGEA